MPELERAGLALHYEVHGKGRPLIALHGFTGSGADFLPLARSLRRETMTVCLDLPGHGRSGVPEDPARCSLAETAADVLALADELGVTAFDLLGYSMGGRAALRLALGHPQRVRRLVLESASPGIPSDADRLARLESDEGLARDVEERGVTAFLDDWLAMDLFRTQSTLPDERRAAMRAQRALNTAAGLAASLRGAGAGQDPAVWDELGRIRQRVLLIGGMEDEKYGAILTRMAEVLPNARLVRVPRVGHNVHLERPRLYADYVGEFLRQS